MKTPEAFFLETPDVPKGSFKVIEVPDDAKGGDIVHVHEKDILFNDEGSLGEDFFASGIIRLIFKRNKKAGILHHPADGDTIKMPHPPSEETE